MCPGLVVHSIPADATILLQMWEIVPRIAIFRDAAAKNYDSTIFSSRSLERMTSNKMHSNGSFLLGGRPFCPGLMLLGEEIVHI